MEPAREIKRFVLLDRDGVINRRKPGGYVTAWREFEFLPRSLYALRLLAQNAYEALVISNQPCVGKRLITEEELGVLTQKFLNEISAAGGRIQGVYYCTHRDEDHCACRKPQPGLFLQAQRDHGFEFTQTYVVGDSTADLEAARRVGSPSVLISPAPRAQELAGMEPLLARDLYEAAELIIAAQRVDEDALADR